MTVAYRRRRAIIPAPADWRRSTASFSIPERPAGVGPKNILRTSVRVGAVVTVGLLGVAVLAAALGWSALGPPVDVPTTPVAPLTPAFLRILGAVALWSLAVGIARGNSLAWWMTLVVVALAVLADLPSSVAGRADLGVAVLAVLVVGFLVSGRHDDVGGAPGWGRWVAVALVLLGLGSFGPIADAVPMLPQVARVAVAIAAIGILRPAPSASGGEGSVGEGSAGAAEAVIAASGTGALLPFQRRPGMRSFVARSGDCVVVYARAGRTVVILGDPIGPPERWIEVLREFGAAARRAGWIVTVYQATVDARDALGAAGFGRIFRIGQEAIVELTTFSLAGSRRANLRHTVTRLRRDGGSTAWFPEGLDDATAGSIGSELAGIDAAWRVAAGPELGFTIGAFRPSDIRTVPLAVAFDPAGLPIAFVTFRPTGADGGFVLDLIRRRAGSVPGAVEACIAEAALGFRAAGALRLSLGLAPIHGLRSDAGPIEERSIRWAAEAVGRWYDIDGLAFFKAKFDPVWIERSIAIRHRRDVLAVAVALVRLHLSSDGRLGGAIGALLAPLRRRRSVNEIVS
ncbi:MAG: DUF2156 domain-containing protein [Chloroflexi bacterium]|nr:DUF2156 domain-containing protein [Chloroflexota bacterium]